MLEPERILRLEDDAVVLLDQRLLPLEEVEVRCETAGEVAEAIRTMVVRGAPAIGIAAAYGIALAAARGEDLGEADRVLRASRPTAVNLGWALDEMRDDPSAEHARAHPRATRSSAAAAWPRTRRTCSRPARARSRTATPAGSRPAATAAPSARCSRRGSAGCSLTSGSTRRGRCSRARGSPPGSSRRRRIPHAVIADSAAASLMAAGEVDCVITGADRIAANGDTANKIGTYSLAVLARHHGDPVLHRRAELDRRPRDRGRRRRSRSRSATRPR